MTSSSGVEHVPTLRSYGDAFWISPTGQVVRVGITHIAMVCSFPEKFGFSRAEVEAVFERHGEPMGSEARAREQIIVGLISQGWIRTRHYANRGWSVDVREDSPLTRGRVAELFARLLEVNPGIRYDDLRYFHPAGSQKIPVCDLAKEHEVPAGPQSGQAAPLSFVRGPEDLPELSMDSERPLLGVKSVRLPRHRPSLEVEMNDEVSASSEPLVFPEEVPLDEAWEPGREFTKTDVWEADTPDKLNDASLGRVYQHWVKSGGGPKASFAILTSWRGNLDLETNRQRFKDLEQTLQGLGLGFHDLMGHGKEEDPKTGEEIPTKEPSLFIPQISLKQALDIAKKYDQYSIFYAGPETARIDDSEGRPHVWEYLTSGGSPKDLGTFHPNRIAQYYSRLPGRSGKPFVFEDIERPIGWFEGFSKSRRVVAIPGIRRGR